MAVRFKTETRIIDRFMKYYIPFVLAVAAGVALITSDITKAIAILVVSCPCAIVLSIPLSFCGGITAAARKGILIKGSIYLETLAKTKIAVFDKTGTLTKGVFYVSDVHTMNDFSQEELIAIATHAEYYSTHPISSSLKAIHHSACCEQYKPEFVDELAGFGIKAIVNGKEVLAGNLKLMEKFNVEYEKCEEHQNGTIVHLAIDKKYAGHIGYSVRPTERRKGYAKAMLQKCLTYCKEIGLEKLQGEDLSDKKVVELLKGYFSTNEGKTFANQNNIDPQRMVSKLDMFAIQIYSPNFTIWKILFNHVGKMSSTTANFQNLHSVLNF